MKRLLYTNNDGIITSTSLVVNHNFTDGQEIQTGVFVRFQPDWMNENDCILKYRYDGVEFVGIPPKPEGNHNFVDGAWVLDIASEQSTRYLMLKRQLYNFIVNTSNFPFWKQVNYSDTYSDLSIQKITTGITVEQQQTLDNIILVRNWKNDLLVERDRVKTVIYSATTLSQIDVAVSSFVYLEPPFLI